MKRWKFVAVALLCAWGGLRGSDVEAAPCPGFSRGMDLGGCLTNNNFTPAVRFLPQPQLEIAGFWGDRLDRLERNWLPHCGERLLKGQHPAMRCNLVEALCLALERHPENRTLADLLERAVTSLVAMQEADGYVGKAKPNERYVRFDGHEFYLQGYFLEAAVRHMDFTKGRDRRLFDAGLRLAEHLDATFGPRPKRTWTNGHPGLEKALLTLSDAVRRRGDAAATDRYARLAQYFLRHQYDDPKLRRDYAQSAVPATKMAEAYGHAVRATYFYAALAGVGWRLGDVELAASARRLFENAIDRKLYLTGGVGAKWEWEAFDHDWLLPNGHGYLEGCASCGLYDWCTEMFLLDGPGRCEDVRERLMYNLLLGVFDRYCRSFSYPNPPNGTNMRYAWHTIPCCVANVPRVLEDYKNRMWGQTPDGKTLYLLHFIASKNASATVGGVPVAMDLETDYPASGRLTLTFRSARPVEFDLVVRFPNRAESALYRAEPSVAGGYRRQTVSVGTSGLTQLALELPMPLQRVTCDARVKANRGQVAWQRGPIVYSREGANLTERVAYCDRLNDGGVSFVWMPADGSRPDTTLEEVPWPCGHAVDETGASVPKTHVLQ